MTASPMPGTATRIAVVWSVCLFVCLSHALVHPVGHVEPSAMWYRWTERC